MKFDKAYFDAGINRYNSGCVKWDDKNACPDGALPMWIADMDFACAPAIANAVKERAQHPCFGYSAHDGAVERLSVISGSGATVWKFSLSRQ